MDTYPTIRFYVNGQEQNVQVAPEVSLLDVLRDRLGLFGTKNGCGSGHCGTCTVILNGKAIRSCLVKMKPSRMEGAEVHTVEGLADGDSLHPLQAAFIEQGAVQCGYCTPGILMASKALIDENPTPTDQDIRSALTKNNNLCRCSGYIKIFEAVKAGAALVADGIDRIPVKDLAEKESGNNTRLVADAVSLVTGATKFGDDIRPNDSLIGKILWSDHPHARILSIDTAQAKALSGVGLVITAEDIPGENIAGIIHLDQPAIAADKVRFIGDPVAAVFAETAEIAEHALRLIQVEYQPLEAVFSPEQAAMPDAPLVHESGNLFHEAIIDRGDVEEAFAACAVIEEGTYTTPRVEHAYLEIENGLGIPDQDGGVTIKLGTQCAFDDRRQLAAILGLPEEMIRVVQLPMGGAFGGKEDILIYQFLALGAYLAKRPVRISLSRPESLRTHVKRHPALMKFKAGCDDKGKLLALEAEITLDAGAYASLTFDVLENTVVFAGGPYYIPNVKVSGRAWYTNTVPSGAMRGFGANQVAFAMESLLDEIARKLGIDPFEIRILNGLDTGLPTISDHVLEEGVVGIKETVAAARAELDKLDLPAAAAGKKIGVGVASAVKNFGYGHGLKETSGADITLNASGEVVIGISQHEMGQGSRAALVRLAADTLGISAAKIRLLWPDTAVTPPTGPTTASRQTFLTGNALVKACQKLKENLFNKAADELDANPAGLRFQGSDIIDTASGRSLPISKFGGEVSVSGQHEMPRSYPLLENTKSRFGDPDFESRPTHCGYAYGTQVAVVEVDEKSGKVKVLTIIASHDLGRVINRGAAEGQLFGGVLQGLGYALSEEFIVEKGINLTDTLLKCGVPGADDTPEIIPVFVEVPHKGGPLGAKGFAEAPSLPTAPAITNAIKDALGVRITSLPVSQDLIIRGNSNEVNG